MWQTQLINKSIQVTVAAAMTLSIGAVFAEEVLIRHNDGTISQVELQQTLDGAYYFVANNHRNYIHEGETCEGEACPPDLLRKSAPTVSTSVRKFGVFGSNTIGAELMPRLIQDYAQELGTSVSVAAGSTQEESLHVAKNKSGNAVFEVDLRAHGSGTSFPGLRSGEAEIGMASRVIKDKEVSELQSAGMNNMRELGQEHVVALDGLVVIVAPDNPISSLSMAQIARIFAGKISNWSEVGGGDQPIKLYSRDDKSGTYDTFKSLVLKPNDVSLSDEATLFESNEELSDAVAVDAGGIGFTGFAYLRNAKALSLSTECGLVSEPSVFSVKTEEYPLARRLYLYTSGQDMSLHARGLLDYSLSDEAQRTVENIGFINQSPDSLRFMEQVQRAEAIASGANLTNPSVEKPLLESLYNKINRAERLSTTFRFRTGSSELDVKSQQDVRRIAKLLSTDDSPYHGKQLHLIGFSDSVGKFSYNLQLSKSRAQKVYELLMAELPESAKAQLDVSGYGELSPIACNTSDVGQAKNRRVEIWVQ